MPIAPMLLAVVLAAPAPPPPPSPGAAGAPRAFDVAATLFRALRVDCGVGDDPPLWQAVRQAGPALVEPLARAIESGPPRAERIEVARAARDRYKRYPALRVAVDGPRPDLPGDLLYVRRELARHKLAYRQRAVRALGWIGTPAARDVLRGITDPALRPYADQALARLDAVR